MPSHKLKKFCRLTQYLEQVDKDLYQAFDDLCLFGLFRVRGNGITFLYPTNKAYRKKIIDHTYSNNPEKAIDMAKALILLDYYPKLSDFKNKPLVNSLHLPVEVAKADTKEVELKSGHILTVAKDFATLRADDPVAVYHMSGTSELPMTGEKVKVSFDKKKKGGTATESVVKGVKEKIENIYRDGFNDKGGGGHNIYKAVISLLIKWVTTDEEGKDYEGLLKDSIGASPRATFYNLINTPNEKFDEIIKKTGLNEIEGCTNLQECKLLERHISYYDNLDKFKPDNVENIKAEINKIRVEIKKSSNDVPSNITQRIEEAYKARYPEKWCNRLYIDLLSVYCRLSEELEEDDREAYNQFTKTIEGYKKHDDFKSHDGVFFYSVFGALLYSDSFLFTPGIIHNNFNMPVPGTKVLFSTQPYTEKKSGGNESGTFFGGVMNGMP